jgi:hypothetical protein
MCTFQPAGWRGGRKSAAEGKCPAAPFRSRGEQNFPVPAALPTSDSESESENSSWKATTHTMTGPGAVLRYGCGVGATMAGVLAELGEYTVGHRFHFSKAPIEFELARGQDAVMGHTIHEEYKPHALKVVGSKSQKGHQNCLKSGKVDVSKIQIWQLP